MFQVSSKWIHSNKTLQGGFTRMQLESIGVPWPPKKGWVDVASSRSITDGQKLAFEQASKLVNPRNELRVAKRRAKKERKKLKLLRQPKTAIAVPNNDFDRSNWKERAQEFYRSDAWRRLRYLALRNCEGKCQACGASAKDGVVMHVDHIKPRYRFPELELELSNLQALCEDCNIGKGAWDSTDWRHVKM